MLNNPLKYIDPSGEAAYPPAEDKPCPECAPNFIAGILNSLRDPANKEWLSKNLSARSIDKTASAIGQGIVKGFKSIFGRGGSSSGPAPNLATNINMNAYSPSGSNNTFYSIQKTQAFINEHTTAIGNTLSSFGGYATALEDVSHGRAEMVYKYGNKSTSALQLTRLNKISQLKIAKFASIGGKALGAAGGLVSGYQYSQGQISGYELSADLIMTGVGFAGPVGAGASLLYFGGKAIYNYYNPNNPVFAAPKN